MLKINPRLLPIKAHYFFFLGAMGPILPYLPVIGKQLGISELVMGLINALLPIFFIIIKPAFGYLIDYFQEKRKLIFLLLLGFTSLLFSSMIFIPHNYTIQSINSCEDFTICKEEISPINRMICNWTCQNNSNIFDLDKHSHCILSNTTCANSDVNCTLSCTQHSASLYSSSSFWLFTFLLSLGTIGYNVSNSISDAICFDVLGEGEQMKYGKQRVWGTIGFGLMALIGGYLIDYISQGKDIKDYAPAYIISFACMALDIFSSWKLQLPPLPKSESIIRDVGKLVKEPHIAAFLVYACLAGICDASMIFYLLWFLEDLAIETNQLTNIKLLEGLTVAAETLFGEVIFFSLSGKILKKLGYGHCLTVCFGFYTLRLGLVSFLTSPWWILPIETLLQGPTYALTYATIVAYANAVSPPGTSATVQGVVAGMDDGLGFSIGSLIGGIIYRLYGGRILFLSYSVLAAIASLSHFILYTKYFKHWLKKSKVTGARKTASSSCEMSTLNSVKTNDNLKEEENKFIS